MVWRQQCLCTRLLLGHQLIVVMMDSGGCARMRLHGCEGMEGRRGWLGELMRELRREMWVVWLVLVLGVLVGVGVLVMGSRKLLEGAANQRGIVATLEVLLGLGLHLLPVVVATFQRGGIFLRVMSWRWFAHT